MKPSTTPDYDILKDYTHYMYNRNLKNFTQNTMSILDFLSEAFATGFGSIDEAKKTIRNSILNEKRRLIARIQQSENRSRFDVREKKCCDCGLPFPIQQFYPRKDKSTGLMYYSSYCPECENKRARAKYAKSYTIKASARRRQAEWRKRQVSKRNTEMAA